jgi:glyoxylate/hydroxypyruvate/2-ketogluconate reductase
MSVKPKIFVARPIPDSVVEYLAEHCEIRLWQEDRPCLFEDMKQELGDVEGLITSGGRIDEGLLVHAPKLQVISNISVGYNNMDITAMKARGIIGTHTPSVLDESVADLVFGLMLSTARRIPELDRHVKEGKWEKWNDEPLFGVDVHHTTLGIIGMGRIGEAIAKRAKLGFEMDVLYHNRSRNERAEQAYGAVYRPMDDLLREADFVVVMVPLSAETEGLIGARQFELMKPSAIFINASRGPVVDEQAMIEALQAKRIRGAGLDVFTKEPVEPNNPLLSMDHTVTLPHIGSATARTRSDMAMMAARNLVAGLRGEVPPNLVPEFREK